MGDNRRKYRIFAYVSSVGVMLVLGALPAFGQGDFAQCLAGLRGKALHAGIPEQTVSRVFDTIKRRPPVVVSDRNQPEFTQTFAKYLGSHVTSWRIHHGRELLREHGAQLRALEAKYGVQPQYVVAFWGLETNYGRVLGSIPVFDSLATLACDPRRANYFTNELISALRIVGHDHIPLAVMKGSWAGAVGQTQFMPSTYLAHGVDGDGDGRVDLWRSVPDALASAANFLGGLGWEPGWRWGREVVLPEGFDYFRSGLDQPLRLERWRSLGVRETNGRPVAALPDEASLLVPAGQTGPAFLVYANFHVIMRWNRSIFFALAVGRLADRIAGDGPLKVSPPNEPPLTRKEVRRVQTRLNALGFDSGNPDGIAGGATRRAVRNWQRAHNFVADGHIDSELLRRMGIQHEAAGL